MGMGQCIVTVRAERFHGESDLAKKPLILVPTWHRAITYLRSCKWGLFQGPFRTGAASSRRPMLASTRPVSSLAEFNKSIKLLL